MASWDILSWPGKDNRPSVRRIRPDTGVLHAILGSIDDYDGTEVRQLVGQGDGTCWHARVTGSVQFQDMARPDGSIDYRIDELFRQQQSLSDAVAHGFQHSWRIFLVSEPVVQLFCLLDKPVPEFVRKREILTPTVWCGRVEDDAILQKRQSIAGAAIIAPTGQMIYCFNRQTQIITDNPERIRREPPVNDPVQAAKGTVDTLIKVHFG